MGGNNSTPRRVTITDENLPAMAITLDVAQRLQGLDSQPQPQPTLRPTQRRSEENEDPAVDTKYMEESVKKVEEHYKKKIETLQVKSEELTRTRLEHLKEAIADAEAKFTTQSKEPVCLQPQIEVFECYRNNPKNSLHCGKEARAFSACVQETKRQVFAKTNLYATS